MREIGLAEPEFSTNTKKSKKMPMIGGGLIKADFHPEQTPYVMMDDSHSRKSARDGIMSSREEGSDLRIDDENPSSRRGLVAPNFLPNSNLNDKSRNDQL